MNGIVKGMVLIIIAVYIVSPIDLCPGPIDDIIVMLMGIALAKGKKAIEDR